MFVIPEDYSNENDQEISISSKYYEYSLDVGNDCIKFSNFFNGTLFIFGDFIEATSIIDSKEKYNINFSKFTKKSKNQIENPVKYDGINPKIFIEKLYKEIDNPTSIEETINYYSDDARNGISKSINLNKIIIKGTCLNSEYSLLSISDVTAKTYIKNLIFKSTLIADGNGVIDISSQLNTGLPTKDKFLFQYPLAEDLSPIISDSFYDYLVLVSNEPYFNLLSSYILTINKSINSLSSVMLSKNVIIDSQDYIGYEVDDTIIEVFASQINELELLPGVKENWTQFDLDDNGSIILSTSILDELKKFNLSDYQQLVDDDIISNESIKTCIYNFNDSYELIEPINLLTPSTSYDDYKNNSGKFDVDKFNSDIKQYVSAIDNFKNQLSAAFNYSVFSVFLSLRPDLISIYYNEGLTNNEAYEAFLENYKVTAAFNSLTYALSGIEVNIIEKIISNNFEDLYNDMTLKNIGENPTYKNVHRIKSTSDDFIKSNYVDGSVDSLYFIYDLYKNRTNYLSLKTKYSNVIGKLLLESNHWTDIKQKFAGSLPTFSPMYDSQYDTTLVFWSKFNSSTDIDSIAFLSFTSGSNNEFKFSLRPYSYSTISYDENTTDNDRIGNIDSSTLLLSKVIGENNNKLPDVNSWIMWSIKIDNTSRYLFRGENNTVDFRNLVGLNVTAYTFKISDKSSLGYEIVRHDLNLKPMNDKTDTLSGLNEYKENNYVYYPFIEDPSKINENNLYQDEYDNQFNDFSINIGYSKEPNANGSNSYYYDGFIRNLMLFKGHLTYIEEESLFRLGILNNYIWPSEYENDELIKLINSGAFFLGLVSIYDSNNINIINCDSIYNGSTYKI